MTHQPSNQSTDSVTLWINAAGRVPLLTAAEELHLGNLQAPMEHLLALSAAAAVLAIGSLLPICV